MCGRGLLRDAEDDGNDTGEQARSRTERRGSMARLGDGRGHERVLRTAAKCATVLLAAAGG